MKFEINRNSKLSITSQIETAIEEKINSGFLNKGEKLPPIRNLSKSLGVSFLTVVKAYDKLENKGVIEKRHGKGCFVRNSNETDLEISFNPEKWQNRVNNYITRAQFHKHLSDNNKGYVYDFSISVSRNYNLKNQIQLDKDFPTYPPIQGDKEFREILSKYLKKSKIIVEADNLLIVNGVQQAINLLARTLLGKGDKLCIAETSFPAAIDVFRWEGVDLHPLPMTEDGVDIDSLHEMCDINPPEAVYIIPNFNNPQGILMSDRNKKELLNLAQTYNFLIFEDDTWSDFYFEEKKPSTIKSYDTTGHVIYLKGFSKLIGVGYRIGAIAANNQIINVLSAAKSISDLGSPQLTQTVVSKIIESENFEIELEKRRCELLQKKEIIIKAVKKYAKARVKFIEPKGGLCLWLSFDESIDTNLLLEKAREKQVNFLPGQIFFSSKYEKNHIRLSYFHLTEDEIEQGIKILFSVLDGIQ